jgi:hypothetical protein
MPAFSSDVVTQIIPAGSAIQISCDELLGAAFIYQSPPPATTYVQGLLVLTSRTPLQVFATRTAQGPAGGLSMQTDPIAPSSVPFRAPSEEKIEICHVPPGNPDNSHELKIGASAWPAHQAHGDTLGDCPDDDDDDDDEIEDD